MSAGFSDLEAGEKAIRAIRRLSSAVGIPSGLAELGVLEQDPRGCNNERQERCLPAYQSRTAASWAQVMGMHYRSAMGDAGTISIVTEQTPHNDLCIKGANAPAEHVRRERTHQRRLWIRRQRA